MQKLCLKIRYVRTYISTSICGRWCYTKRIWFRLNRDSNKRNDLNEWSIGQTWLVDTNIVCDSFVHTALVSRIFIIMKDTKYYSMQTIWITNSNNMWSIVGECRFLLNNDYNYFYTELIFIIIFTRIYQVINKIMNTFIYEWSMYERALPIRIWIHLHMTQVGKKY